MGMTERLMNLYGCLYDHFGPQGWWPADTPFEVSIGAILTQNTSWVNVEKAIENLKKSDLLAPEKLHKIYHDELAALIRPAGYYNIKARRIKNFTDSLMTDFSGSLEVLFSLDLNRSRRWLLAISGIGPETADSILLYAGNKPVFVVDAYTYRVLMRHGMIFGDESYDEVQEILQKNLINGVKLFNEFHALLVVLGKNFCTKNNPRCASCPVKVKTGWKPVLQ